MNCIDERVLQNGMLQPFPNLFMNLAINSECRQIKHLEGLAVAVQFNQGLCYAHVLVVASTHKTVVIAKVPV